MLGIDLGSREVKVVLMENHKIVHRFKVSTMSFYRDYCSFDGKVIVDLEKLNLMKFRGRKLILSGGTAYNDAIKQYLKNDYDEVISLEEPQFNGAIGCCYYGERVM